MTPCPLMALKQVSWPPCVRCAGGVLTAGCLLREFRWGHPAPRPPPQNARSTWSVADDHRGLHERVDGALVRVCPDLVKGHLEGAAGQDGVRVPELVLARAGMGDGVAVGPDDGGAGRDLDSCWRGREVLDVVVVA